MLEPGALKDARRVLRGVGHSNVVCLLDLTDHTFRKILKRAGEEAKLSIPIHPHMLRHSTGFKLANDGIDTRSIQHYLGHKNIQHTVRYTELASSRFKNFWKD